jgi:DNA-binding transcriptional LysR family regulator
MNTTFDKELVGGIGVFAAIVDAGTFSRAAEALDLSQSGVSRAVARLEGTLGARLFDRTTRSVRLTDEGRRFRDDVVPALRALQDAADALLEGRTALRGRLRVNVDPFFSRIVLGPHLGAFLERHPELEIDLVGRDALGDLVGDGFDCAIRFGHPRASTLVARKLLDSRMLTIAAPAYLARHGRPADPRELEGGDHVCIQFRDPTTGRPFPWEFHRGRRRVVLNPPGRLVVNDAGTLYSACLAGYGMAQVMDLGTDGLFASGHVVNVFPDWLDERFPLYAFHPSRRHVPAKTRAFLDFVRTLLPAAGRI